MHEHMVPTFTSSSSPTPSSNEMENHPLPSAVVNKTAKANKRKTLAAAAHAADDYSHTIATSSRLATPDVPNSSSSSSTSTVATKKLKGSQVTNDGANSAAVTPKSGTPNARAATLLNRSQKGSASSKAHPVQAANGLQLQLQQQ
jgi:hypothetical protein